MEIRKVEKAKSKLRIGVSGVSGSGKTYSAILLAKGLTDLDKVCVIDTENGSADLYQSLGEYNVLTLTPPFSPERYAEAIKTAERAGMEVVIIDSITHEWDGEGGILQLHEQLGGNSFTAWAKLTPRHNNFIQAILQSPCHIITTVRRKQDYAMTTDGSGKTRVEKKGLKEVTREGFEYELTLSFDIAQNHLAVASKDRTGLFMDKPELVITEETGKTLKEWAEDGVDYVEKVQDLLVKKGKEESPILTTYKVTSLKELSQRQLQAIIGQLQSFPDVKERSKAPQAPN